MAKAYIMDFDGGTTADYDAVIDRMELGGQMPPGGTFHYAGPMPSGLRVIDLWADPDAFDRFAAEKIGPIAGEVGLGRPRIEAIDVAQEQQGDLADTALVQVVRLPGLDAESFAAMHARVLPDGRPPAGLVHHVNGPYAEGWIVIDSWTSKDLRDEFIETRVRPAAEGAPLSAPPIIEDLVVHARLVRPAVAQA
jgi:hypothetical protein